MGANLYLIPSSLGKTHTSHLFPEYNIQVIKSLDHFIIENVRSARRFLRSVGYTRSFDEVSFYELNKHTPRADLEFFIQPLLNNINMGVLSEAGVPAVADPGSEVVKLAHQHNIRIIPLVGPSSVLLALMASGLNGQNFSFLGYLPVKSSLRRKSLKLLERRSLQENQSQIFMEAPYRNIKLLQDILSTCHSDTLLCIATNITLDSEFIQTKSIHNWKSNLPEINKKPTIFILYHS